MKNLFILIYIIISTNVFAQAFEHELNIVIPQTVVGNTNSSELKIKSLVSNSESFHLIENGNNNFTFSDSSFTINGFDSISLIINYNPKSNVRDKGSAAFLSNDSSYAIVFNIESSGLYGDSYDASTFDKYDVELKTALTILISGHNSLGYNLARDKMFMEIDNKKVNGQGATQNTIECVYTGRLVVGYQNRTEAQNQNFNTEHTWPQGTFNQSEPMRSDLHHLFPTDETANNQRSNYPFGIVVSGITWQNGGSKLGRNSSNAIVFEPRDVHKGDVARAMLYFILRYPTNYQNYLDETQENVYRLWNVFDLPDAKEIRRNNDITLLQNKANPLVVHPEFVDRIYNFRLNVNRPQAAAISVYPFRLMFDTVNVNSQKELNLFLVNNGNKVLRIDSIRSTNNVFEIENEVDSISKYSLGDLKVKFTPSHQSDFEGDIIIYSELGTLNIGIKGVGNNPIGIKDENRIHDYALYQNYPNPFNPETIIKYEVPIAGNINLSVYNLLGEKVAILTDGFVEAGVYTVNFNASNLSSGIYFYVLRTENIVIKNKMILIR